MSITNISNLNLDKSISEDGAWSLISVKSCCSSNPNWITIILYCQRSIFNLHITILRYQTNTFPISPCQTKWQEQGEKPNHCSSAPTVVLHQQSPVLTVGLWGAGSPTSSSVSSQTESECGPTPTADCPSHHHLSVIERTHKHISRTHTIRMIQDEKTSRCDKYQRWAGAGSHAQSGEEASSRAWSPCETHMSQRLSRAELLSRRPRKPH